MKTSVTRGETLNPALNGTNIAHSPDFVIDRPRDPFGSCLIFSFRSPGVILTADGMKTAAPGDCVIHSVDFYQYHAGVPGVPEGYRNDFLHVPPGMAAPLMRKAGLPYNRVISTAQPEILTAGIKDLQLEFLTKDEFSGAMIINILEKMLLDIARAGKIFQRRGAAAGKIELRYLEPFTELRNRMRRDSRPRRAIKDMARELCLSQERFAVLYKKFFGRSPYDEIIEARLQEAKRLLACSGRDIQEIAADCGWSDAHYFSRIFKQKIGVSPAVYRSGRGGAPKA
jgi:AraC family transcriptional regulator of arabinose operon